MICQGLGGTFRSFATLDTYRYVLARLRHLHHRKPPAQELRPKNDHEHITSGWSLSACGGLGEGRQKRGMPRPCKPSGLHSSAVGSSFLNGSNCHQVSQAVTFYKARSAGQFQFHNMRLATGCNILSFQQTCCREVHVACHSPNPWGEQYGWDLLSPIPRLEKHKIIATHGPGGIFHGKTSRNSFANTRLRSGLAIFGRFPSFRHPLYGDYTESPGPLIRILEG